MILVTFVTWTVAGILLLTPLVSALLAWGGWRTLGHLDRLPTSRIGEASGGGAEMEIEGHSLGAAHDRRRPMVLGARIPGAAWNRSDDYATRADGDLHVAPVLTTLSGG